MLESGHNSVPFTRDDVRLIQDEIQLLELDGAVFRDDDNKYWLTEMLRLGLGFKTVKGGRSPFLALWQKALRGK